MSSRNHGNPWTRSAGRTNADYDTHDLNPGFPEHGSTMTIDEIQRLLDLSYPPLHTSTYSPKELLLPENNGEYRKLHDVWDGLGEIYFVAIRPDPKENPDNTVFLTDTDEILALDGSSEIVALSAHQQSIWCEPSDTSDFANDLRLYNTARLRLFLDVSSISTTLADSFLVCENAQLGDQRRNRMYQIWKNSLMDLTPDERSAVLEELLNSLRADRLSSGSTAREPLKRRMRQCYDELSKASDVSTIDPENIVMESVGTIVSMNKNVARTNDAQLIGIVTATLAMLRINQTRDLVPGTFNVGEIRQAAVNLRKIAEARIQRKITEDAKSEGYYYTYGLDPITIFIFRSYRSGNLTKLANRWHLSACERKALTKVLHSAVPGPQKRDKGLYRKIASQRETGGKTFSSCLQEIRDILPRMDLEDSPVYIRRRARTAEVVLSHREITSPDHIHDLYTAYTEKKETNRIAGKLGVKGQDLRTLFTVVDRILIDGVSASEAIQSPQGTFTAIKGQQAIELAQRYIRIYSNKPRNNYLLSRSLHEFGLVSNRIIELSRSTDVRVILDRVADSLAFSKYAITTRIQRLPYVTALLGRMLDYTGHMVAETFEERIESMRNLLEAFQFLRFYEQVTGLC